MAVECQSKGVQQIQATNLAFAAIFADGLAISRDDCDLGCDSSALQIQAINRVFAAKDLASDSLAVERRRACSRFRPLISHLQPFLQMVLPFPGAIVTGVVTALL